MMNRLISESDLPEHNMSSQVQDNSQMDNMWNDYFEKIKYWNPGDFNTVRLNEPKIRYKKEMNASAGNVKEKTKRYDFPISNFHFFFLLYLLVKWQNLAL